MTVRLMLIGDVGDRMFHIGDEAMFETAINELHRRGDVAITAVTSGPSAVEQRYGVDAVGQLGFDERRGAAYDGERDARLQRVLARSADGPEVVAWWDALDQADAVLVCGGGNLTSSWPHLVYERIALLSAAHDRGLPIVLVGQSVGPHLTRRQSELLAPLLAAARFVGVRDQASRAFVRAVSPDAPVTLHIDDAISLPNGPSWTGAPDAYVAMSLHPVEQSDTDALHDALRMLATSVRDATGADVVLLPNTGSLGGELVPGSDAAFMTEWASGFGPDDGIHVAPMLSNGQFAATVRASLAVVSSRFHPLVFGLGAAVPCLGLTSDRYTARKISGALTHAGLDGWRLPFASIGTPLPTTLATELFERRDELVDHLTAVTADWADRHSKRWDLVWRCLSGERPDASELQSADTVDGRGPRPHVDTALMHRLEQGWYDREERHIVSHEAAEEYAHSLKDALDRTIEDADLARRTYEHDLAVQHDRLIDTADELAREQRSADAARAAAAQALHELSTYEPVIVEVDHAYVASLERELAAMRSTRLFRWTRPLRSAYGRIRRSGSRRPG